MAPLYEPPAVAPLADPAGAPAEPELEPELELEPPAVPPAPDGECAVADGDEAGGAEDFGCAGAPTLDGGEGSVTGGGLGTGTVRTGGGRDGVDTVGVVTVCVGTDTVGTETVGTDTVGTETVGTETLGTETFGTETVVGTVRAEIEGAPTTNASPRPATIAVVPAANRVTRSPALLPSRRLTPLQPPVMSRNNYPSLDNPNPSESGYLRGVPRTQDGAPRGAPAGRLGTVRRRMPIALFDTDTPLLALREEILDRLTAVVERGIYILGPEVEAFERELAEYMGVRHAIGVGNGTDAITIALRALGVKPGDEVVVPSFTFYASAEAIVNAGGRPVFCDVDPDTRNVTLETVRAVLTPRTVAIVSVDLFGLPAPSPELRSLGLPVLEDAAQAAGASLNGRRAGSLGDVATFSFYPSKNLGAFGDGGAITTDDDRVAELVRSLRFHGSRDKKTFDHVGYNSRLDELQAAILRVALPELDGWCDGRRAAARAYAEAGLEQYVTPPVVPAGAEAAWHLYAVTHPRADAVIAGLGEHGVQARAYYRTPLHRQPAMAPYAPPAGSLPVTDELARTNLALPMSPTLSAEEVGEVVAALAAVAG